MALPIGAENSAASKRIERGQTLGTSVRVCLRFYPSPRGVSELEAY